MPLDLRNSSIALSTSPPAAASAFLHSSRPSPVRSRNSFTNAADMDFLLKCPPRRANNEKRASGSRRAIPCGVRQPPSGVCRCLRRGRFLDELVASGGWLLTAFSATRYAGIRYSRHVKTDCANGVVIPGNHVVNAIGVTVCVDDADNRDTQLVGFGDGDALVIDVDNEQGVGQTAHILDTADAALELVHLPGAHERFLFRQLGERAIGLLCFKVAKTLDGRANGLVVCQHTAEPAVADKRHAGALGLLLDDLASGTLGAHEQDLVLAAGHALDELQCFVERRHRVLEVDDVDFVAGTEDVLVHLRIPVTGLVTEVRTGLQQVAHAYL